MTNQRSNDEPDTAASNATIELFVHSEGNEHPTIFEVVEASPVSALIAPGEDDVHIWIEGADEEIDVDQTFAVAGVSHHQHVHKGHCNQVGVSVRWGGNNYSNHYSPAATIAIVEKWAFHEVAHFSPEQAAQHVLMEPGADHFLAGSVHVGSLIKSGACEITLDLVARSRFEG